MGWATGCLRGLFGKSKSASPSSSESRPRTEKKLWSLGKSFPEKAVTDPASTPPAATPQWAHPVTGKEGGEQSKRAIAVAAATAVVAEAAVATAHAAAAVVRMTSSATSMDAAGKQELAMAAVRIQAAFRGYLARRALKALRGLVKLQALVRGNMVRRQATETLRCMQALVHAQARARECRALRSQRGAAHPGPPPLGVYDQASRTEEAPKPSAHVSLKRSTSKAMCGGRVSTERSQSCRRNWLDGWTERCMDDERSVKTLEVDTGKPGRHSCSSRRRGDGGKHMQSSYSTLASDRSSWCFSALPDSPSKDSTTAAQMSVRSPSSVGMGQPRGTWRLPVDIAELCATPQLFSASSRPGSSRRGALTPTMSECSRVAVPGGFSDYPNYMAKTESFRAKARSQSAPKQRLQYDKSGSIRKPSPAAQKAASLHAEFASKA